MSVHFNAGAREDAGGVETYSLAPRGVPSTNNANLSLADFQPCIGNIRDPENIALATAMHAALITRLGGSDRGIKRARFIVLRDCNIPGVLIEGGFLTNRSRPCSDRDTDLQTDPGSGDSPGGALLQSCGATTRSSGSDDGQTWRCL